MAEREEHENKERKSVSLALHFSDGMAGVVWKCGPVSFTPVYSNKYATGGDVSAAPEVRRGTHPFGTSNWTLGNMTSEMTSQKHVGMGSCPARRLAVGTSDV